MAEYFLKEGMSGSALEAFFAENEKNNGEIHALVVWKDDKVVVRAAPEPYSVYDKAELYSLSKSFCATAVGMLIDEGRMALRERLADIFPREARLADERLARVTIQDLLTMRSGHEACTMPQMKRALDPISAFFRQTTKYEPGRRFVYNTGATYMLSAAVQKRTGMTVLDYLEPRLFTPLGIAGQSWNRCGGVSEGGIGLHLSADDIVKLGVLYLQKGVWEGKRLLSEQWVADATTPHADNSMNGTPDWCAGYGYQFWNNAGEGYRGDGAFGQLCVVLPEKNMVIAVRGLVKDMQSEINSVQKLASEIESGAQGEGFLPAHGPLAGGTGAIGGLYRCDVNPFGWTQMRIRFPGRDMLLCVQDGEKQQELRFGGSRWTDTQLRAKRYCPKLVDLQDNSYEEEIRFAGSWEATEDGTHMLCRYQSTPHVEEIFLRVQGENLEMQWTPADLRAKGASRLTAVKIGD